MWNLISNISYYENLLKRKEEDASSVIEVDFTNLCRCCLRESAETDNLLNVFEMGAMQFESDGRNLRMLDLLQPHGLSINECDVLPKQICNHCIQIVTNAFFFKMQVQKAQSVLSKLANLDESNVLASEAEEADIQFAEHLSPVASLESQEDEVEVFDTVEFEIIEGEEGSSDFDSGDALSIDVDDDVQHEKSSLEQFRCLQCRLNFEDRATFLEHKKTDHPNNKPFNCKICGKGFNYIQSLRRHAKSHNDQEVKKPCPHCDKGFLRNDDLKRHIRTHTNERPYSCDLCEKSYKQHSELKEHSLTHSDTKHFKCEICGKELSSRNGIYVHMKTHQNIRQHSCDACGKRFVTRGELVSHVKHIHEKSKPFVCEVEGCGRAFVSNSALNCHRRKHAKRGSLEDDSDSSSTNNTNLKRLKICTLDNKINSDI